jgi:hypothetical protein
MNRHSKANSLIILQKLLPIKTIIDVGVSQCTEELIYLFPDKPHILCEPNAEVYSDIKHFYRNINYTLIKYAINETNTLDNAILSVAYYNKPYLLKVDVDGPELEVLNGATETLKFCSCIVIECTVGAGDTKMTKMLNFLNLHNFSLWDMTDMAYYKDQLWQVDLVFVNNNFMPARKYELIDAEYWKDDTKDWMLDPTVVFL